MSALTSRSDQAEGLRHSSRGHRPRNAMTLTLSRPVRALQVPHYSLTVALIPSQIPQSLTGCPENSNSKSTPANPKSTVDLGLEPLIWVENALQRTHQRHWRHSICPTTTRKLNYQNQNKTKTNQKINRALMFDLGICPSLTVVFGVVNVFVSQNSNGL